MEDIIEDKDRISKKLTSFKKNINIAPLMTMIMLSLRPSVLYANYYSLMSGVIIGGIMGWSFDKLFGTSPWLLIVFVLGVFAGISNVIRTANRMNKLG